MIDVSRRTKNVSPDYVALYYTYERCETMFELDSMVIILRRRLDKKKTTILCRFYFTFIVLPEPAVLIVRNKCCGTHILCIGIR